MLVGQQQGAIRYCVWVVILGLRTICVVGRPETKGSALNELLATVVSWTLRVAVVLAGLVFFASLLIVAVIAALLWGARMLWAKLTGKPVVPFAFKMSPASGWTTVYQSTARWTAKGGSNSSERAAGNTRPAVIDVTDVEPREIRSQH